MVNITYFITARVLTVKKLQAGSEKVCSTKMSI